MDQRGLLGFTTVLMVLLQLQAYLAPVGQPWLSAGGWLDRHPRHQLDRRRLATDLVVLAVLR
jgi:hypothetical protein